MKKLIGSAKKSDRPLAWFKRLEGPNYPGRKWAESSWFDFFQIMKKGGMSAKGAWWLARALMLQRGKSKYGYEELERLTFTILSIIDAVPIFWDAVLPLPLLGPDSTRLYTVSYTLITLQV